MITEYSKMVRALVKSPKTILIEMSDVKTDYLHAVIGIASEAGELLDACKKCFVYNQKVNVENIIEELGDLEFYIEQLRQLFDISREDTLKANMDKLAVRYKEYQYSDLQAKERNDKKT